ncbi:hypothetical protein C7974DRAFT_350391 [Boeremia exigua]|uniref:uncharacterized protein n=1 Tax=Boeremia exigua TaxID=749465 RepID=UPI001E8E0661|nr:uncharacterized protein C7974DRAFT_350391 [Boeremia exigua]KAH6642120.1 hypothetical protein C7974DRAFT_350391 [Boeremia exigua]
MPRLGHKKSRLGCRQCKTRHVKCDELKPCTNCARHGVQCSLITDPPPSAATSSGSVVPKRDKLSDERNRTDSSTSSPSLLIDHALPGDGASDGSSPNSQSDQFPFLRPFVHKPSTDQSNLWVRDIELMHHWTIEAYDELSQRDDMRHTWRVEAPKFAVTHTFLMHEILAFAALHKASKLPDRRREYYTLGIHHQDLAIKGMRPKLQNIVPEETPAILATSTLLTLGVFASTGFEASCADIPSPPSAIDGILNIFSLMQGMGNVLALAHENVLESFLAPMFRDPLESTPSQPLLQELIQHLPQLVSFVETKQGLSEQERTNLLRVINDFEPVLKLASPPRVDNRELRFLFFWPLHLDGSFLVGVQQRHPGSLVVLMYYATMLFAAEPRYWFMDGWGHRLMKACYDSVDQSWLPVMQWPLSFLEASPTWSLFQDLCRFPGGLARPQGPLVPAYAQQTLQTVPFRQPSRDSSDAKEHRPVSTLDRTGPAAHLTSQVPPSYAPQMTSASYLSPMSDAASAQNQPTEHDHKNEFEATAHLQQREAS